FDTIGYVVVQAPEHVIENAKVVATDPKRRKKQVKAQPPTWGYKHWDEAIFQKMVASEPEALVSRFSVDHGRLLSLMQHAQETTGDAAKGYDAMVELISRSHLPPNRQAELRNHTAGLLADLEAARVAIRDESGALALDSTLQHDFSLHHSLSLFLIDALARLEPASPSYPLDVVTWVEAILDDPRVVLARQLDREKGARIAELKAAGVPYEERMEALELVEYPKPLAEQIFQFYNAYAERHPWVKGAELHPKSIAREMIETWSSFASYVNDLGLQRAEGVLLRYLSEVYKGLLQNVPADQHTDPLLDVIAYLRAMLGRVDASLLAEWENLVSGTSSPDQPPRPIDISEDRRRFAARIRAEVHALVRALSRRDWEEAATTVRPTDEEAWGPEAFAAALAPFHEEHGDVGFDHRARMPPHTVITPVGPHQWEVSQRLFPVARATTETYALHEDDEDDTTWTLTGRIDLRENTNPDGPLLTLVSIAG
ncbi:MAG: DUF3516 domain-containing protein, partial [Myxococcota bacterium]